MSSRLSALVAFAALLLALAICPGRCTAALDAPHCGHCHGHAGDARPDPGGCRALRAVEPVPPSGLLAPTSTVLFRLGIVARVAWVPVDGPSPGARRGPSKRLWLRTHALLI